jgi:hypothetical protein
MRSESQRQGGLEICGGRQERTQVWRAFGTAGPSTVNSNPASASLLKMSAKGGHSAKVFGCYAIADIFLQSLI